MEELEKYLSITNFVNHPDNYSGLIKFWKQTFAELTGTEGESYISNQYANGKEILDGNPIFSSRLGTHKGIRIIQMEPDTEQSVLSSWMNKTTIDDSDFEELVIAIQLKPETYTDAKRLILLYFNEVLTSAILLEINQKYDASRDLGKIFQVIHRHDYFKIFRDFHSLYQSSLDNMDFSLDAIKLFHSYFIYAKSYNFGELNSPIQRSFHAFMENINHIEDLLSLKATVDLKSINDKSKYVFLITDTWGSTKQYIDKLHSYTTKAEEEYEYLKDHL